VSDSENSVNELKRPGPEGQVLSTGEISQLVLGSSLAATKPLVGLIKFLIKEKVVDGHRLKAFLEPLLVEEGLPPATKAMLEPIWKSFLAQITDVDGSAGS
jgi:hypothetical protein